MPDGSGHFSGKIKTRLQEWAGKIAGVSIAGFSVDLTEAEKVKNVPVIKA